MEDFPDLVHPQGLWKRKKSAEKHFENPFWRSGVEGVGK